MSNIFFSPEHKGFTLVELLVAMTIFSVVILITLSVLFSAQKAQQKLDKKYADHAEADRIMKELDKSLRTCQKLIQGSQNTIRFLDIDNDTIEYTVKVDTLLKNGTTATYLSVKAVYFTYVSTENKYTITDFYDHDADRSGVLDSYELKNISGIETYMKFMDATTPGSKGRTIEKKMFTVLRNLQ